jgi:hypothetical protein
MQRAAPQQLELEVAPLEPPRKLLRRNTRSVTAPRLALSPDEAAAMLGVSRDYFDEPSSPSSGSSAAAAAS